LAHAPLAAAMPAGKILKRNSPNAWIYNELPGEIKIGRDWIDPQFLFSFAQRTK
jgi:hypothetical protein